ncbi:asparaginase-domain-containing protein [Fimicolochytrium jonesii]|uniref:asparaginase-domain-containing protein n=1 Tax=Fimicolochytrium jonesii TaxID=1396493 RepID=UPI0022FE18A3|nr:asparaginase-domain-containing protein [Fimicolochytrium jonesii]KAI8817717.1 asparaginase-domain-containing protein [Fimicolochytrium jonesii]
MTAATPTQQPIYINDAVNSVVAADVLEDMVGQDVSRVLIIYTGGTIGMKNTPEHGYRPEPGYLSKTLAQMVRFHDPIGFAAQTSGRGGNLDSEASQYPLTNAVNVPLRLPRADGKVSASGDHANHPIINGTPVVRVRKPALITPPSLYGKRIRYSILEYEPLLDSSNMVMNDWVKIATDIEVNYTLFDAFIVLHGTDTMAFTASALSFMLENLGKTVILSGSQVPLSELRNDAVDNVLGALTIAGHFVIPEVGLFFNNKFYRGNRSSKVDAVDFNAFDSPNLRPLVNVGINIDVSWEDVLRPTAIARFQAHKVMEPSVATLRLFPGITEATVRAFLSPPIKGVVLETYGSGNAPNNRQDILTAFREASDRGVVIVNCTQCKRGLVTDLYATGKALLQVGVVPGADMTPECALTKLSYLLGKHYTPHECRNLIRRNLRGELTVLSRRQRFTYQQGAQGLVHSVMSLLGVVPPSVVKNEDANDKAKEPDANLPAVEKTLVPILMCQAAKIGDIEGLQSLIEDYYPLINHGDYDGRTPLHIACSENQKASVEFLLLHGANVHLRDRFGHSALWDAVRSRRPAIAKLLREAGAHFSEEELEEAAAKLFSAVLKDDLELFKFFVGAGADLNKPVHDGRTSLHMVCRAKRTPILNYIIDHAVEVAQKNTLAFSDDRATPPITTDSPTAPIATQSPPSPKLKRPPTPITPTWHRPASPLSAHPTRNNSNGATTPANALPPTRDVPPSWVEVLLDPVDDWGATPLEEAREAGEEGKEIVRLLSEGMERVKAVRAGAVKVDGVSA